MKFEQDTKVFYDIMVNVGSYLDIDDIISLKNSCRILLNIFDEGHVFFEKKSKKYLIFKKKYKTKKIVIVDLFNKNGYKYKNGIWELENLEGIQR